MAKVVNILKTIRNNWKKSVFGSVLVFYGVNYGRNKYEISELMREYCQEAVKYGEQPAPLGSKLRQIIVILNPAANKRKAKANFEKFCGPLLYLAGISVTVVQTESEGQARGLVENLDQAVDAIVVAGGDGTVSEVVTGLLRRPDGNQAAQRRFPVGILPLGQTNTVAGSLFAAADSNLVRTMADATMAVVREVTRPLDVVRVQALETEDGPPGKPVYCLGGVRWGAYRDAHARRDKYWYWDGLRAHVAYVFCGLKSGLSWHCEAGATYARPCAGCSKCRGVGGDEAGGRVLEGRSRLWHAFLPWRSGTVNTRDELVDYSKVQNSECGMLHKKDISTVEFSLTTENVRPNCHRDGIPHMEMCLGPPTVSYTGFVSEGWRRVNGQEPQVAEKLQIREIVLRPVIPQDSSKDKERWISIDNEDYELKPIHVTLLPKKIHVFCTSNVA
ncbi:acylglycerol kinase, mitochondrial [Bacillus rossius redtenbacheri]|uniref:acylglycerol kinase, mitochondrial n=1 Tax=Bacillus rossius redtenbacheri TaxID=93214 RepID=UPI002FDE92E9